MMKIDISKIYSEKIANYHLPRYAELPDIELYSDQLIQFVGNRLSSLIVEAPNKWITTSMVHNYTKQNIMKRPISKRYNKEHIADLVFISVIKSVMSMSDIKKLLEIQSKSYPVQTSYDYFCEEFENALKAVFTDEPLAMDSVDLETKETAILRAAIITAVHQIHLNQYLVYINGGLADADDSALKSQTE
ncbi:MAG: DUF1836 domain-containing protein [Erysipelotrichaceae bacterium]